MSKVSKKPDKKKGVQPKTSPKHAEADVRRTLFVELESAEASARSLLNSVNKLRHGNLDYIAEMASMQAVAETVAEEVGRVGQLLAK